MQQHFKWISGIKESEAWEHVAAATLACLDKV